jgi:hypothetical protein
VRGEVFGDGAVAPEFGAADAQAEHTVGHVGERVVRGRRRGARQIRLDEDDVRPGGPRGGAQRVRVEGPYGRGVQDGDVEAVRRGEDGVEHRSDGDDHAGAAFADGEEARAVDREGLRVRLDGQPYVHLVVARGDRVP